MTASFTLPIPTYQCHKRVQALKIKLVVANPCGFEINFEDSRYCPIQVDDEWVLRHNPLPGGYMVWYPGDVSFSPAAAFEAGYTLVDTGPFVIDEAGAEFIPEGPATQAAREVFDEAAEVRRAEWHAEMRADAFGHPHE